MLVHAEIEMRSTVQTQFSQLSHKNLGNFKWCVFIFYTYYINIGSSHFTDQLVTNFPHFKMQMSNLNVQIRKMMCYAYRASVQNNKNLHVLILITCIFFIIAVEC